MVSTIIPGGVNNTNSDDSYSLSFPTWVVYQSMSSLLIVTSLYILVMLFRYSCVHSVEVLRSRSTSVTSLSRCESGNATGAKLERSVSVNSAGSVKRSNLSSSTSKALLALCLMGSFFALLRVSADQLELATYGGERVNCKLYQIVVVVTYSMSATCLYTALWTRLRVFYGHPIMKHLYSLRVIVLVWFALFCILASSILNTTIFLVTVTSVDSQHGCVLGETVSVSPTIRYVILALSTVISQTLLLSLFLFPLLKHRSNAKSFAARSRTSSMASQVSTGSKSFPAFGRSSTFRASTATRQAKKVKRKKRLIALIRRVLFTAVTCVASDVAASIITIVLTDQPRVVSNMVFNFNLIVNVISVLLSFGDWTDRIAPCCTVKKKDHKQHPMVTIPTQSAQDSQTKSPTTPKISWRTIGVESPESTEKEITFSASGHDSNELKLESVSS